MDKIKKSIKKMFPKADLSTVREENGQLVFELKIIETMRLNYTSPLVEYMKINCSGG